MILEETLQLIELRRYLPELFVDGIGKSLLYVGASKARGFHVGTLWAAGYAMTLVEVFSTNALFWRRTHLFVEVEQVDIREYQSTQPFDVAMWWHGPEHIERGELPAVLEKLESIAPLVVLACPNGEYAQGSVDGNDAERHCWTVQPDDLLQFEYSLAVYQGTTPEMLAWKRVAK